MRYWEAAWHLGRNKSNQPDPPDHTTKNTLLCWQILIISWVTSFFGGPKSGKILDFGTPR
ncbi:hypothetical protein A3J56_03255 [Candidatus Giovannonibacteria bacterium RIFCSPHIGHO2_02_FULL_46_20]|uniref:Uncharacterized protein n=1 Tax=Candidatus Giovannonibacteria bacterium RIFCSPHIGHO2_02_FULL_46_20 TaxID=1798338 RepID=A0A1F5WGF8_9BACT|nr:MAG: hypothetical protein A3J56_03255 [Candidatus Giovannonibacteria bacterium RIFCSPHIGHO2_02_FULL_46_20]